MRINKTRMRKKAIAAAALTLATTALTFGTAGTANATAVQTRVIVGYSCFTGFLRANQCVAYDSVRGFVVVGSATPEYDYVTTYIVSFDSPASGSAVATTKPALQGTAKPGDTVIIKNASGAVIGTTAADGNGNWSFTPPSPLPYGSNTLSATQSSDGNTATTTFTVSAADLATTNTLLTSPRPQLYTAVEYTLAVKNNGPASAPNVRVSNPLPAGLTYLSSSGTGSYNPSNGVWSVGTLGNGQSATLTVRTRIDTLKPVTSPITASSSDLADPTPCPGDCGPAPTIAARAPLVITSPTSGSTIGTTKPLVTGTGVAGAPITLFDTDNNQICATTVDASGNWACQVKNSLPQGPQRIVATQDDDGTITASLVNFIIADTAADPVIDPWIGGGALLVTGGVTGLLLVRRRQRNIPLPTTKGL